MQVQPYLNFDGRCEEALDFYRGALGAEVTMLKRFKESPEPGMVSPGSEDKVMHASFRVGWRFAARLMLAVRPHVAAAPGSKG